MTRRRVRCAAVGVLLLVVVTACSTGSSALAPRTAKPSAALGVPVGEADRVLPAGTCRSGTCSRREVAVWRQVPFTPRIGCGAGRRCRLRLDVFAPTGGGPHPVVVLLAGGPNSPANQVYANVAGFPLAARGAVVMRADWRQGAAYGGGWPASMQDAACAVGVARRLAATYGGRADDVVLAGHSLGGWVAAVVGLSPRPFTPHRADCLATRGSLRPDAVVTLAGAVAVVRDQGLGAAWLADFFGGSRGSRPLAWAAGDPFVLAARSARGSVALTLVRGGRDTVIGRSAAPDLLRALRASGHRVRYALAPAADHDGVLTSAAGIDAALAAT